MNHKGIMIILDGLGDRPQKELNGLTPLEAAQTTYLDQLISKGLCGLVHPFSPGITVGTQTGTGLLLGMDPVQIHKLTRGTVEAAGVGMMIQPGDIAIRCNFATITETPEGWQILDRRAGRIREGTQELADALDGMDLGNGITASFKAATQHRAILRLSGPGLSAEISDTDPGSAANPSRVLESYATSKRQGGAEKTAHALNRFFSLSVEKLKNHPVNKKREENGDLPANGIISRGSGVARNVQSVVNKLGLKACVIAGEHTLLGLSRLFNFTTLTSSTYTSLADTNLHGKIAACTEALEYSDLVFLHIKAPDIFAHDLDPVGKSQFIEEIDSALQPLLQKDLVIGITADHSTDSRTGNHTGDPVPSIIFSPYGRRDGVTHFGEKNCMSGGLGHLKAHQYLHCLLDAMGVSISVASISQQEY